MRERKGLAGGAEPTPGSGRGRSLPREAGAARVSVKREWLLTRSPWHRHCFRAACGTCREGRAPAHSGASSAAALGPHCAEGAELRSDTHSAFALPVGHPTGNASQDFTVLC